MMYDFVVNFVINLYARYLYYIPETNHFYKVYSVAAVLWLQFVLQALLFPISTYVIKPTNAHVSDMFYQILITIVFRSLL
jgi:hypothetical protein